MFLLLILLWRLILSKIFLFLSLRSDQRHGWWLCNWFQGWIYVCIKACYHVHVYGCSTINNWRKLAKVYFLRITNTDTLQWAPIKPLYILIEMYEDNYIDGMELVVYVNETNLLKKANKIIHLLNDEYYEIRIGSRRVKI